MPVKSWTVVVPVVSPLFSTAVEAASAPTNTGASLTAVTLTTRVLLPDCSPIASELLSQTLNVTVLGSGSVALLALGLLVVLT